MNSSPFFVFSKLPGCGSPCSSCSGAPRSDRTPQASQRVAEKLPTRLIKLWRVRAVADQPLRFGNSIREVRRCQIDLAHAGMVPLECLRVLGWRDVSRRHRLVVRPQRDREAVTHVDTGLHPRFERFHRAAGFGKPPTDLDFELGAGLMRYRRDPSENVTRGQAQGDAVRVMDNDRIVDSEAQGGGRRPTRLECSLDFGRLHRFPHVHRSPTHRKTGWGRVEQRIGSFGTEPVRRWSHLVCALSHAHVWLPWCPAARWDRVDSLRPALSAIRCLRQQHTAAVRLAFPASTVTLLG